MHDPTPALDALVEQGVRPRVEYLSGLVAEMIRLPGRGRARAALRREHPGAVARLPAEPDRLAARPHLHADLPRTSTKSPSTSPSSRSPASTPSAARCMPADAADDRLRSHVHPPDWINPEPRASLSPRRDRRRHRRPGQRDGRARDWARAWRWSSAPCSAATAWSPAACRRKPSSARRAPRRRRVAPAPSACDVTGVEADFGAVMQRMRERRADISPHDSASRLRSAGVDVYFGEARFTSRSTIEVAGRTLAFKRAVIATGGRPAVPPIPGLSSVAYLTNETLFSLTELPRRLAILGAGSDWLRDGAGVRAARQRRDAGGSGVRACCRPRDADAAADRRGAAWREDGVAIEVNAARRQRASGGGRHRRPDRARGDAHGDVACDRLLVAVGRAPNVDAPRSGGGRRGRRPTASPSTTACGPRTRASSRPATSARRFKFTHAADAAARIVIQNASSSAAPAPARWSIPWCTYTDSGGGAASAGRRTRPGVTGTRCETITDPARRRRSRRRRRGARRLRAHPSRARPNARVHGRRRRGRGDDRPARRYALKHGARLGDLGSVIYPYPTQTNAFRAAGDAYGRSRLTPRVRAVLKRYFGCCDEVSGF